MHAFSKSDKKLIFTFIVFSLTFFTMAMIALFFVIYTSDASDLFKTNRFKATTCPQITSNLSIPVSESGISPSFLSCFCPRLRHTSSEICSPFKIPLIPSLEEGERHPGIEAQPEKSGKEPVTGLIWRFLVSLSENPWNHK